MRWKGLIAGMLGLAAAASASADDHAITIYFHVRPPYAEHGAPVGVKGLLVTPVIEALNDAGLHARWAEMPPARQTQEIKRTDAAICGLGWFKRPEREYYATFSAPIYQDRPNVIVVRKGDTRFSAGASLKQVFADPGLKLVLKTGYSYGGAIDAWLKSYQPSREESSATNEAILNMIANNRNDYVIMAPEEAEYLLSRNAPLGDALRIVTLSDAPEGEQRYLMCSKSTPADALARLNAKLAELAGW